MNSENKSKKKKKINYFWYDFVKVTGVLPTLLWMRPKVYHVGDPKSHRIKGGALVISNHVSFMDPIMLHCVLWRRRLHCLATKDLYRAKFMRLLLNLVNCIQVDKENFSMSSFHTVIDRLKAGCAVLIFPEGQVNPEEEMLTFKSGAVLMAHRGGVPILPVYVTRRDKWYKRSIAVVGDPIDVCGMCGRIPTMEEMKAVSDCVRDRELELMRFYQTNILRMTDQSTCNQSESADSDENKAQVK